MKNHKTSFFTLLPLCALVCLSLQAFAQTMPPVEKEIYYSDMTPSIYSDYQKVLPVIHEKFSKAPSTACTSAYQNLFNKPDIHWSIFFGYGDVDDEHTTDMAERALFEKTLTEPCQPGLGLCGFKMDVLPGRYIRQISTRAGSLVNIHLRLIHSSLTSDKKINEGLRIKDQMDRSLSIESQYLESLTQDDIVFYSGHARHGSGPGFRPMEDESKDWWIATLFHPMRSRVINTLQGGRPMAKHDAKLIGIFACEGEAHYGSAFTSASSGSSALLLTRETMWTVDNMRALYAGSNSLMLEACEDEFQAQLTSSVSTIYYYKQQGKPSNIIEKFPKIFNFFERDQVKSQSEVKLFLEDHLEDEVSFDLAESTHK